MEWLPHELLIFRNMVHWAPIAILSLLLIILIVGADLVGVSRNDRRIHHKGTIIGTVGIVLALAYTVVFTVYQLIIVNV